MKNRYYLVVLLGILFPFGLNAQVDLIPYPQELSLNEGKLSFKTFEIISDDVFEMETSSIEDIFPSNNSGKKVDIILKKGDVKNPYGYDGAYSLEVSDKIYITAPTSMGIYYGIQTLRQLTSVKRNVISVQKCKITDWPAFGVRGFFQDVGRNFMSVEILKEQIDVMAMYKYNVFHFHLTENEGWRLESKIYPQLQSDKAFSRYVGKYYTQEEFKDIVKYCAERHITVIPEFDIPGHSLAIRKAFNIENLNSEYATNILKDLFGELCSLVSLEQMPYIHLGTDEVKRTERVDNKYLLAIMQHIESLGRSCVAWWHGIKVDGDKTSIKQLWAQTPPLEGHKYIDSRSNYINHMDPLVGMSRLFFQQPCRAEHGDDMALGGILCCWNDNNVGEERNVLKQNPIYPAIVTYSNSIWRGVKSTGMEYWGQLPPSGSKELENFIEFEERLVSHRDKYFKGKEFPYLRNVHIPWKIIGPFDHEGDMLKSFPVEEEIKDEYVVDGKTLEWKEVLGGTVHLRHFFDFPTPIKEKKGTAYAINYMYSPKNQTTGFWISFHGWSRSGRRGGPLPADGQWHTTDPKIWINDELIAPPKWTNPGIGEDWTKVSEIPYVDEDYFYRTPTMVKLKKGWNKVFLKIPQGGTSWKWMFTVVPVSVEEDGFREVEGIRYTTDRQEAGF